MSTFTTPRFRLWNSSPFWLKLPCVSAQEIIQRIKVLPLDERAKIANYLLREDTSWIPEDFQAAMDDLISGRLLEMEMTLRE